MYRIGHKHIAVSRTSVSRAIFCVLFLWFAYSCAQNTNTSTTEIAPIVTGAEHFLSDASQYAALYGKKTALVVNQTSVAYHEHLVDTLLNLGIQISKIFAPEHGFRGEADAGEKIEDNIDIKTGLPIVSLYGKHKKPTAEDLSNVDIVLFDIQDVGVRFYTYISTLHYVMEACAENQIPLIVLDRPNPNGHYIDGSVLDLDYQSFVGMHSIPVVYGMTIGEVAMMIQGEGWLYEQIQCELSVVPCLNYNHEKSYSLPIRPSPNLPNDRSIELYPSICFFEGTTVSVGRGTDDPFQVIGSPDIPKEKTSFDFTPSPNFGAKYPKHNASTCYGFDLRTPIDTRRIREINLDYLLLMYQLSTNKASFFLENGFFDLLAGTDQLRLSIIQGKSAEEIKASWQEDLNLFKSKRENYLLYD